MHWVPSLGLKAHLVAGDCQPPLLSCVVVIRRLSGVSERTGSVPRVFSGDGGRRARRRNNEGRARERALSRTHCQAVQPSQGRDWWLVGGWERRAQRATSRSRIVWHWSGRCTRWCAREPESGNAESVRCIIAWRLHHFVTTSGYME